MKRTTIARTLRKILLELKRMDPPLVNRGRGFYFAETPEDVREGTKRDRQMAYKLLKSVAIANKSTAVEAAKQLELEFGGVS